MRGVLHLLVVSLAVAATAAPCEAQRRREAAQAPGLVRATRADMAAAYVRLETLLYENEYSEAQLARANRVFDVATMRFFSGGYSAAVQSLEGLMRELGGASGSPDAAALRLEFDPPVLVRRETEDPCALRVTTGWLYANGFERRVDIRFIDEAGRVVSERLGADVGRESVVELDCATLPTGAYAAQARVRGGGGRGGGGGSGGWIAKGRVFIVDRAVEELRAELETRLDVALDVGLEAGLEVGPKVGFDALAPEPDELQLATTILRARLRLLTDRPSPERPAEFLADMARLSQDLERETSAIERGVDPYTGFVGDMWRAVPINGVALPMRVVAPAQAAGGVGGGAVPLVIAFHGAGGDENLFFDGYGAGRLEALAREHGFIAAAPLTSPLAANPAFFERIVETLDAHYEIDQTRIYVMGHSMGAGITAGLVRMLPDHIAGAVCFAGGGAFDAGQAVAPTRVYAPELDPIIPARGLVAGVEAAQALGRPVELRYLENRGHTLVVGEFLDEAVLWLLGKRRQPS